MAKIGRPIGAKDNKPRVIVKKPSLTKYMDWLEGKQVHKIKDVCGSYWYNRVIKQVGTNYIVFENDETNHLVTLPFTSIELILVEQDEPETPKKAKGMFKLW